MKRDTLKEEKISMYFLSLDFFEPKSHLDLIKFRVSLSELNKATKTNIKEVNIKVYIKINRTYSVACRAGNFKFPFTIPDS
jgi:hypothetical protein